MLTVESGGLAYVPGSPDSATVTIADDPPVVGIVATDPGAAEAGVDPGGFTLIRNGGNLDASLVTSFTIGGSAANNSDYAFISVSLTIPAGSASATVTITPLADNLAEGDETVTLTIEPRTSYIIDPTSSAATVTIVDDPPVVTVTATDADAAEAGLDPGAIVVARSGGNLAASLNAFVQRSGTATSGLDFVSIGGGTILVTIPGGANDATLAITPHDDLLVEGPETVILTLQPSSSYTIGSPGAATVTIADDD